jgi:N-acetylmuramoyl-L-alanine amidase
MQKRRGRLRKRRPLFVIADKRLAALVICAAVCGLLVGLGRGLFLPTVRSGILQSQIIYIDPGHGGIDPGACGRRYIEKDIVLKVALSLGVRLEKAGAQVVYTRTGDYDLETDEIDDANARLRLIDSSGATIVLSLHCNAFPDPYENGAQTFYNAQKNKDSERLAKAIQEELVKETGTQREVSARLDHFILNYSKVPSVTVELGFLSNPEEEDLLGNATYQHKLAQCIFNAVCKFVEPAI